jgi:hypothetical protein
MYLIINQAKRVMDITSHAQYIKRQKNGVVINCSAEDADAIYSADSDCFFPLERTGYIGDGHSLVEVEIVPDNVEAGYYFYHAGEFYSSDAELARLARDKAANDAPALAGILFVLEAVSDNPRFDETTMLEHARYFIAWDENWTGARGQIVQDAGGLYKALHDVLTPAQNLRPSTDTGNLIWKQIGNPADEWPQWSQPIAGVDNFYMIGDKVSFNDKHWVSDTDNNVWAPGAYGWTEADKED